MPRLGAVDAVTSDPRRGEDPSADVRQSQGEADPLVQFVKMKGTQVAGRHKDRSERIAEAVSDLELVCEGAYSLARRTERADRVRWSAALARACSVFLRKMVIGDRNDPATRLLDDQILQTFGVGFARLRKIESQRRTLEIGMSMPGAMVNIIKRNEATGEPEGTASLPIAPHRLTIAIEWPLPGAASWTAPPTNDRPWTIAPEELFQLAGNRDLDRSGWLGQQLVMFDQRGITLKDVIRTVATYEGAHSINVSRLLQEEVNRSRGLSDIQNGTSWTT